MLRLLFWNTMKGRAIPYVQSACLENDVDVLILAEDVDPPALTESALNLALTAPAYKHFGTTPTQVRFYHKTDVVSLRLVSDEGSRISVREVTTADGNKVLVTGTHLPSKRHAGRLEQYAMARILRNAVEAAELAHNNDHSLVIGDFNMSPYETGMIAHDGMHGMMDEGIARKVSRKVQGKEWSFFYNPMWNLLGDRSTGPSGTYFYNSGKTENFYWNTFDQVLIRPSLLSSFNLGGVRVVTQIGTTPLIANSIIDSSISDHLPVLVTLDL